MKKKYINISKLKKLKNKMTSEQKRKLLIGLRKLAEEYTGNVGGETDITNPDNLTVSENEFTSTQKPEPNVITKTFDTHADFDNYVKQRRGIEITSKEAQSVMNYKEAKPTEMDRFHIKFETTDDFSNNTTVIIKKLKEGNEFCWTAFTKYETADEESEQETSPEAEKSAESIGDKIRITKSITFTDEVKGSDILADFLLKLNV